MNMDGVKLQLQQCSALKAAQRFRIDHFAFDFGAGGDHNFAIDLNRLGQGSAKGLSRLADLGPQVAGKADGQDFSGRHGDTGRHPRLSRLRRLIRGVRRIRLGSAVIGGLR